MISSSSDKNTVNVNTEARKQKKKNDGDVTRAFLRSCDFRRFSLRTIGKRRFVETGPWSGVLM